MLSSLTVRILKDIAWRQSLAVLQKQRRQRRRGVWNRNRNHTTRLIERGETRDMQPQMKVCPQCQTLAALTAPNCIACGHIFRTKFTPPVNQTQVFYPHVYAQSVPQK